MRRTLLLTMTTLLILMTGCSGSSGSDADPAGDPSTSSASASGEAPTTTTTTTKVAEVKGDLLEPGDLPAPWVAATDTAVHTFDDLDLEEKTASSASCPKSIIDPADRSTQCFAFADEGGPFAELTATAADGTMRTTLLCQSGDADSLDFTAVATIDATVASHGLGAVDADGRASFEASAYKTGTGTEWFVARRPAGQDCPVLWNLGADDGTLAPVSALGAVTLPLADGPTCVFVVPEGLRTRPPEDGFCMP